MLADDAENVEALGELEKLYEREKMWNELGAVLRAAGGGGVGRHPARGDLREAGRALHREGPERRAGDDGLAGAAAAEPDNRRAQDALKKLYLQQKDWNALEGFYAAQGKWDELVRVLERQAESEDGAGRVGLWNKIGELYRDRLQKADRAQKAYEKVLSFDGKNLQAAEALIPLYEKAKDVKHLAEVLFVELRTHDGSGGAAGASQAARRAARSGRGRQGRARCASR